MMEILTGGLVWWHWLILVVVLIGIEMSVGTYDFLWVAVGAILTMLLSLVIPDWRVQLVFFAVVSVALVFISRTYLSRFREENPDDSILNKRMDRLIGTKGIAVSDFQAGRGRVKIGDTEWSAECETAVKSGDSISVEATTGNAVKVKIS